MTLLVLSVVSHGLTLPCTIPFLGREPNTKLNQASKFIDAILKAEAKDALDGAKSCIDGDFEIDRRRVTELVGPAYNLIAKKANEPRKSHWKDLIRPILNAEGTTIWVRKEFVTCKLALKPASSSILIVMDLLRRWRERHEKAPSFFTLSRITV